MYPVAASTRAQFLPVHVDSACVGVLGLLLLLCLDCASSCTQRSRGMCRNCSSSSRSSSLTRSPQSRPSGCRYELHHTIPLIREHACTLRSVLCLQSAAHACVLESVLLAGTAIVCNRCLVMLNILQEQMQVLRDPPTSRWADARMHPVGNTAEVGGHALTFNVPSIEDVFPGAFLRIHRENCFTFIYISLRCCVVIALNLGSLAS